MNKVISRSGSEYTLNFSDGRKERFSSRGSAENRERQIQYFKHRNKMLKGGPGSGRTDEGKGKGKGKGKAKRPTGWKDPRIKQRPPELRPTNRVMQPRNVSRFTPNPTMGRRLGHLITSTTGGALQGGILGSLLGPLGTRAGAVGGAFYGGARGLRNVMRNRIPNTSTSREAIEQGIDVGTTALLSRLPYGRIGRFIGRGLRRR